MAPKRCGPHLIVSGLRGREEVNAKLSIGIVNMTLMTVTVGTGFNSGCRTLERSSSASVG